MRTFRQLSQCWHSKEPWRPGPSFRMYRSFIGSIYLLLSSKPDFKKLCCTHISCRSREKYGFWISNLFVWFLVPLFYLWLVSRFSHCLSCHLGYICLFKKSQNATAMVSEKIILDGVVIPEMFSCNNFLCNIIFIRIKNPVVKWI